MSGKMHTYIHTILRVCVLKRELGKARGPGSKIPNTRSFSVPYTIFILLSGFVPFGTITVSETAV